MRKMMFQQHERMNMTTTIVEVNTFRPVRLAISRWRLAIRSIVSGTYPSSAIMPRLVPRAIYPAIGDLFRERRKGAFRYSHGIKPPFLVVNTDWFYRSGRGVLKPGCIKWEVIFAWALKRMVVHHRIAAEKLFEIVQCHHRIQLVPIHLLEQTALVEFRTHFFPEGFR
jgi:hypothetical protein